jgi:hypothetical protein
MKQTTDDTDDTEKNCCVISLFGVVSVIGG